MGNESRTIARLIYKCVIALAKSDNPSLAGDLIVRIIIDRPDGASWHTQSLERSFFKRLPAESLLLQSHRRETGRTIILLCVGYPKTGPYVYPDHEWHCKLAVKEELEESSEHTVEQINE